MTGTRQGYGVGCSRSISERQCRPATTTLPPMIHRVALACVTLLLAGETVFAADTPIVVIRPATNHIDVELPLTAITSKVRPKERGEDGSSHPIAPKKTKLGKGHYLEWQIGYDTPDKATPQLAEGVVFQRKGETKYGYELATLLQQARRIGLVKDAQFRSLLTSLTNQTSTIEEGERVVVEKVASPEGSLPPGFQRAVERSPQFLKESVHGTVQIQLKEKQRAVGVQAMLYVCLPMDQVLHLDGTPRPPGPAKTKEHVLYRFDSESIGLLLDVVRAFGMASKQHNEDLRQILGLILER